MGGGKVSNKLSRCLGDPFDQGAYRARACILSITMCSERGIITKWSAERSTSYGSVSISLTQFLDQAVFSQIMVTRKRLIDAHLVINGPKIYISFK